MRGGIEGIAVAAVLLHFIQSGIRIPEGIICLRLPVFQRNADTEDDRRNPVLFMIEGLLDLDTALFQTVLCGKRLHRASGLRIHRRRTGR